MKSSPKVGRLEEMAKFVNTRVFELVTKKMGDDKKVAEQKDVINADRMKQCFKPITKKVIQGVLSEHLTSKIEHIKLFEAEGCVMMPKWL
ncbi:unnamed protein product [Peronospora belbahrii]|uniref:Uncharacterized protein n=1 Tax=Peronospora belbahrii TaxID=622444 RepID=A0AAU9LIC2_9STRA|nr:unnamed protein product [Peronospora belbahrii]